MKLTRIIFAVFLLHLAALAGVLALPGCATAPAARTEAATTLRIVGLTAKAGIDSAALLFRDGKITSAQWAAIAGFYDLKFQPAFELAVATARADLASPASPELIALAAQFAALVAELTAKK
jgi:hypothetical protein